MQKIHTLLTDGLWRNNPALVQLLGLCPLLAVSNSVVNGLGLGLATWGVLLLSNGLIALFAPFSSPAIRLPLFVLLIAASVSFVELIMQAVAYELYQKLGIFIPLIVTNCVLLARAESFAARNKVSTALWDACFQGLGFLWVLLLIGAIRELFATGGLLAGFSELLNLTTQLKLQIFTFDNQGFLLAVLPPGAFIVLGLLLAGKNALEQKLAQKYKLIPIRANVNASLKQKTQR